MDYRKETEYNLSEVLQVEQIFSNASKGKVANKEHIQKHSLSSHKLRSLKKYSKLEKYKYLIKKETHP